MRQENVTIKMYFTNEITGERYKMKKNMKSNAKTKRKKNGKEKRTTATNQKKRKVIRKRLIRKNTNVSRGSVIVNNETTL